MPSLKQHIFASIILFVLGVSVSARAQDANPPKTESETNNTANVTTEGSTSKEDAVENIPVKNNSPHQDDPASLRQGFAPQGVLCFRDKIYREDLRIPKGKWAKQTLHLMCPNNEEIQSVRVTAIYIGGKTGTPSEDEARIVKIDDHASSTSHRAVVDVRQKVPNVGWHVEIYAKSIDRIVKKDIENNATENSSVADEIKPVTK
jgi:hypothetical protein